MERPLDNKALSFGVDCLWSIKGVMMKDDPTIKAVRDARRRISGRVGHDPRKLVEHYRQLQERHRERLVSQPSQRSETEGENAA